MLDFSAVNRQHRFTPLCHMQRQTRLNQPLPPYPRKPCRPTKLSRTRVDCAGVYCSDKSSGIHDRPLTDTGSPAGVGSRWGGSSSSSSVSATARSTYTAYGATFDPAATLSNSAMPAGRPSIYGRPGSSGAASSRAAGQGKGGHRPPTPTLNFVQFMEAIRLICEDLVGHPQVGGRAGNRQVGGWV